MNRLPLILSEPPELSDEGAAQCLDFLYELTVAFEKHYANQLRRYYEPTEPTEPTDPTEPTEPTHPDLFNEIDSDPIPF